MTFATHYANLQQERKLENQRKILAALTQPLTLTQLARQVNLSETHVGKLVRSMPNKVRRVDRVHNGKQHMSYTYVVVDKAINATDECGQVIYHNPYSQLTREPDFIQHQHGKPIPFTTIHNQRPSNKSARTFVSGSSLA